MSEFADYPPELDLLLDPNGTQLLLKELAEYESDLKEAAQYQHFDFNEFPGYPGKEHYKLLGYLSSKINNSIILDIGTHRGVSAFALSKNKTNKVHSFDIFDKIDPKIKEIENIEFHIADLWNKETRNDWHERIMSSALIFLDIDPHDGPMEYEFYCYLRDNNYQGIVIVDDIWYFKGMRDNFWYHVPSYHKIDLTKFGHWSGTGLIRFGKSNKTEDKIINKSWTFVTGYFDLTKCPDASDEIRGRPNDFYLKSANTTMALDANLIVYCEPNYYEALEKLRPLHLKSKTAYIICEFDDFPLNQYRDKIISNRTKVPLITILPNIRFI